MRLLSAAAVVALASVASPAAASPEDIYGYGARSQAMGGAGAASSQGFEAAYTNPALLANIRDKKLSLGFQSGAFDLHADGGGLPGRVSYQPMRGIVIGADIPIPFAGVLKDRVGAALAFYTPTDVIVRGRILYPETPQFPLLPDRSQSLMVRAGLGVDVGWGVRVGAGFAALAEIAGSVLVATDSTGRVGSRVEDQLVATYAPTFGATWDIPVDAPNKWRIGATFRGTLDARFAVEIDATKLSSLTLPIFNIAGVAQYDPAQVAVELAHERGPWTLAAGGVIKMWSKYPGLIEPTILCPADNPDCGALQPTRVAFSNTLVLRVGAERAFVLARGAKAFARAGVFREPTPVPSLLPKSRAWDPTTQATVDVPTNFFDADRWAFTLGGGIAMTKPLPPISIDVWAQYHVMPSRKLDVETTSGATVSGHALAIGLLAGVTF